MFNFFKKKPKEEKDSLITSNNIVEDLRYENRKVSVGVTYVSLELENGSRIQVKCEGKVQHSYYKNYKRHPYYPFEMPDGTYHILQLEITKSDQVARDFLNNCGSKNVFYDHREPDVAHYSKPVRATIGETVDFETTYQHFYIHRVIK